MENFSLNSSIQIIKKVSKTLPKKSGIYKMKSRSNVYILIHFEFRLDDFFAAKINFMPFTPSSIEGCINSNFLFLL